MQTACGPVKLISMDTRRSSDLARFRLNMQRIAGLTKLVFPGGGAAAPTAAAIESDDVRADLFRAIVVFLHATFEDGLRTAARQRLADAAPQGPQHIPLVLTTKLRRAEKFPLVDLLRRRGYRGAAAQVGHGLDPTVFRKRDARGLRRKLVPKDSFVVGYVGRIHKEKGLDTLVKALSMIRKTSVLVLVGRGPYRDELEGMIQQLQLQDRVYWVPWVHSDEVIDYMNAFDVLTLRSEERRVGKECR